MIIDLIKMFLGVKRNKILIFVCFVYFYRLEKLILCIFVDSNDDKFGVLGNELLRFSWILY